MGFFRAKVIHMHFAKTLHTFSYKFSKGAGPLSLKKLQGKISNGNCRLAVQDYYYQVHKLYLKPKQILLPTAFKKVGKFVETTNLQPGDLIYAEKLRNKKGEIVFKPQHTYNNEDEWILHFHTAVYLGKLNSSIRVFIPITPEYPDGTPVIWHSSFISNGTSLWSLEKFSHYYRLVATKRVI